MLGLIKFLIGSIGVVAALWMVFSGWIGKKTQRVKNGFKVFGLTAVLTIMISIGEWAYLLSIQNPRGIFLRASREAPIGGVFLTLYNDSTFTLDSSPYATNNDGTYLFKNDTLILISTNQNQSSTDHF